MCPERRRECTGRTVVCGYEEVPIDSPLLFDAGAAASERERERTESGATR
jgi:hypothetical protein